MQVGDSVIYRSLEHYGLGHTIGIVTGQVINFVYSGNPKEFRKVKVFTASGIEEWIAEYCEKISADR